MAVDCTAENLAESAKCFQCIPNESKQDVMLYLLREAAGLGSATPTELVEAAKCFDCIPASAKKSILIYLLCQIVNT